MKRYYWLEWGGAWSLWVDDGEQYRRCLFRIYEDKKRGIKRGMWLVDRMFDRSANLRGYTVRYNDLERAKARCVIEVLFSDEGESK